MRVYVGVSVLLRPLPRSLPSTNQRECSGWLEGQSWRVWWACLPMPGPCSCPPLWGDEGPSGDTASEQTS